MEAQESSRLAALVAERATQALGVASSGAGAGVGPGPGPGDVGSGGPADSILLGLPAARLLLRDDPAEHAALAAGFAALAQFGRAWDGPGELWLADHLGHRRDVYQPFVLHLHLAALRARRVQLDGAVSTACVAALASAVVPARVIARAAQVTVPPEQIAAVLWQALCLREYAEATGREHDAALADAVVDRLFQQSGPSGALHARGGGQALDAWTYRELAGLHALADLALRPVIPHPPVGPATVVSPRNPAWARRVQEIAAHHLEHTQPDHTTNQPWGVLAFAWAPATRSFAEQQLHDATAHGSLTGQGRELVGMLLADAAAGLRELAGPVGTGDNAHDGAEEFT